MKTLLFIFFNVAIVNLAYAAPFVPGEGSSDCPHCIQLEHADEIVPKVETAITVVQSIEDQECKDDFLADAKKKYEELHPSSQTQITLQKEIHGKLISGTQEQLEVLEKSLGETPPDHWHQLPQSCNQVVIALTWGFKNEESAYLTLSIAKKSGYIVSLDQKHSIVNAMIYQQIWKPEEIRVISKTVKKLPSYFLNLKSLESIYRVHDSLRYAGSEGGTAALASTGRTVGLKYYPGYILVFKGAFDNSDFSRAYSTIAHEIGHHYDYEGYWKSPTRERTSQILKYDDLSEWKKHQKTVEKDGRRVLEVTYTSGENARFVDRYSSTNPYEDFASAIGTYVYEPEALLGASPKKYEYMKSKLFNGREYLEPETWEHLEQLINPKMDQMVDRCFSKVKSMLKSSDGKRTNFTQERKINRYKTVTYYRNYRSTLRTLECIEDESKPFIEELKKDADFCEKGGEKAIKEYLRKKVAFNLAPYLAIARDVFEKGVKENKEECIQNKDLRKDCFYAKTFERLMAEHGALPEVSQEQKQKMMAHTKKLLPPPVDISGEIYKDAKPIEFIEQCLLGVERIRVRQTDDSIMYQFKKNDGTRIYSIRGSTPSVSEKCKENIGLMLKNKGYKTDASGSASLYEKLFDDEIVSEIFKSLESEVFIKVWVKKRENSCYSTTDECHIQIVKDLVINWAKGQGISEEKITDQFYKIIADRIRSM